MKLPCEMIRDLLPLYHDGVCSGVSKTLVAEHLKTCGDCAQVLQSLDTEIRMPRLEADEARPLRSLKVRWKRKTRTRGILIGLAVFLVTLFLWVNLTQNCSVPITAEEYTVTNLYRFSNGMYYLEYSIPYDYGSYCADCCRSGDGSVHITEYRPVLAKKAAENGKVRHYLIDPVNNLLYTDTGSQVPLTAFYLGCPDKGDALLLWSADMDIPLASPEIEKAHLYQFVFR